MLKRQYGEDNTKLFFAKALSFILLSCGLTMLAFDIYFMFAGPRYFSATTKLALIPVYFAPVIAFAIAYKYLIDGNYERARSIFTAVTIFAIVTSINLTGGFFVSIASPFLVVVPVMVFLLFGMGAGATIALIVPILMFLQTTLMYYFGLKFPDFTSYANTDMNTITTNLALYLLVISMVASYEYQRNNLRKEVQVEREKLAQLATQDPLTGLSNSRHLFALIDRLIANKPEKETRLAMLFLDLNNFKHINDNFGHLSGDAVLIEIASRIKQAVRAEDTVIRLGGDEFVILIQKDIDRRQLSLLKQHLYNVICQPIEREGASHQVYASIGLCRYPEDTREISMMMKIADENMYRDKFARDRDNKQIHSDNHPLESIA